MGQCPRATNCFGKVSTGWPRSPTCWLHWTMPLAETFSTDATHCARLGGREVLGGHGAGARKPARPRVSSSRLLCDVLQSQHRTTQTNSDDRGLDKWHLPIIELFSKTDILFTKTLPEKVKSLRDQIIGLLGGFLRL